MNEMHPNPQEDTIFTVWQAEIQEAGKRPYLAALLLQKGREIYRRFAHYYRALQSLSRRARRQLLQKFAIGLGGLALAMAINGGPVLANNIAVTTTAHGINLDGQCSLVEAIITANDTVNGMPFGSDCSPGDPSGPDTIQLSGNTYLVDYAYHAIYGPTGLPNVTSQITIEGNGATIQAVQSASRGDGLPVTPFRIMSVGAGGSLTVDNATLTGGNASSSEANGGAIFGYNAAITITNTAVITGNQAAGTGGGIALYSYDTPSNLTITDSTISGNTAFAGGGIANLSYEEAAAVTVNNSVISGNTAYFFGGGILNLGYISSSVTIENNSQINNNSAYIAFGGGIANISFYRADVTVQGGSVISGNESGLTTIPSGQTPAGGIPFTLSSGGGIFNTNSNSFLTPVAEGAESNAAAAMLSAQLTQWESERPTVQPNAARGDGALFGATVHINDSTVTGNLANGPGGGVSNMGYGLSGIYVANNAAVTNNTAVFSSVVPGLLPPHGGGLYNSAIGCGCPPLPPEMLEAPAGALPPFGHTAILTVDNSTVSGNTADGNGGGIHNYAYGQAFVNVVNNATISDNSAYGLPLPTETTLTQQHNGRRQPASVSGSEPLPSLFGFGGGIFNDSYYGIIPESVTLDEAPNSTEGIQSGYSQVLVNNSTISGNTAQGGGGGVANHSEGTAYSSISNHAQITNNTAVAFAGGGISTYGYYGAAISNIVESTISGNQANANSEGGGVDNYSYQSYAGVFIEKSTISGNSAGYGGGFYNGSDGGTTNATVSNSTISGNSAAAHGGGLDVHAGAITLTHATVTNNSAPDGGGIYAAAGINLYNSIVAGNPTGGDCNALIAAGSFNLDSDGSCVTDGVDNNMTVADPLLGPLQVNAPGNTATHALLIGSPAIDAIPLNDNACGILADDQRGVARPEGAGCDMGAFEWRAFLNYLPIVMNNPTADLVVTNLNASGGNIQVTIRNQGTRTVNEDFWVDLYLNPSPAPTAVNQVWKFLGQYGAAWGVTADLAPGQELTLRLNDTYFDAAESNLPAVIPAGTVLYAQVDAAHVNTNYGAVLESHEISGGAYNNISGPQTASAPVTTRLLNYVSEVVSRLRPG